MNVPLNPAIIIATLSNRRKEHEQCAAAVQATVARIMRALALMELPIDKRVYLETHETPVLLALRIHLIQHWRPSFIHDHRANESVLESRGIEPYAT